MPQTVSVILPFYNAEDVLETAIQSILDQTYCHFELLLINNNSSDRSEEIARRYQMKDPRIKLFHEAKQGIVHALNNGYKNSQGQYIARMDADDESLPDRLEQQVEFLNKNKDYGMVAGQVQHVSYSADAKSLRRYVDWSNNITTYQEIQKKQFIESPFVHPTIMWRKEVGESYGLYKEGSFPEDYELWLRWLENSVKMHKIPHTVLRWHDLPQRLTRTHSNYSDEAFFRIKSAYLAGWLKKHNRFHPDVFIWGASKISRKRTSLLADYGIRIKAFIDTKKTRRLDVPVIYFKNLPPPGSCFVLVYMKHQKIRAEIQSYLHLEGFEEGKNYLLVS